MLVFIDESGHPGFKFSRGSDPVFGIGMVVFADSAAAGSTSQCLDELREQLQRKTEFKFSKSSDELRDAFFPRIAKCPFTIRALLVRKASKHWQFPRNSAESFYNHCEKMLIAEDGGTLCSASVRIDGCASRAFQRSLSSYLRRELGTRIRSVRMSDSAHDPLMQLADMCIGAITRAERDRDDADRWKRMLAPPIAHIFYFG
jgi:hypothetical protein